MGRRFFSLLFVVIQILLTNKSSGYVMPEGSEYEYSPPVARLIRSAWYEQSVVAEDYKRDVLDRLISYFRWSSPSTEDVDTSVIAEGVGEVFVQGDDICTGGVTEVEGTVPIGGSVTFSGPVRASGTVTIAGRCAPASGVSPLRIGQPLSPASLPSLPVPPVKTSVAEVLSLPDYYSIPIPEVLSITEPALLPTVALPPVVIPAVVIPAYVLPEVVIPASEVYELATGTGNILVSSNDVIVSGTTYLDGSVPTLGEVVFSGFVPAKGTVTVCSCF